MARKAVKGGKEVNLEELELKQPIKEEALSDEEILEKVANIFSSQPEHVPKIVERFIKELEEFKNELKK